MHLSWSGKDMAAPRPAGLLDNQLTSIAARAVKPTTPKGEVHPRASDHF